MAISARPDGAGVGSRRVGKLVRKQTWGRGQRTALNDLVPCPGRATVGVDSMTWIPVMSVRFSRIGRLCGRHVNVTSSA